jgi:hypothetical protein
MLIRQTQETDDWLLLFRVRHDGWFYLRIESQLEPLALGGQIATIGWRLSFRRH